MDLTRRAFGLGTLGHALAACGGASPGPSAPVAGLAQVRSGTARRVALGGLSVRALAEAQRAFGVDLLGATCKASQNTTVSPASAALALGLLTAAADKPTEKRISAMLHLPRWSDDVVAAYAAQHQSLASLRSQLQLSNRVYVANGNDPEKGCLDDWATGFDAGLTQLDIANHPKESTARINSDVKGDTSGLIPKLLDKDLDADTLAVLVSALHLKADWQEPFDKGDTKDAPFTTDAGVTVQVPMMTGFHTDYRSDGGWESVTVPYRGRQLEMVLVLPPKGNGCGDLTAARLAALSTGAPTPDAGITVPKVDLAQTHDLLDLLADLGLPVDGGYPGIHCNELTRAVQKVVLRVDEKGTEAAAATAIGGTFVSAPYAERTVVFDRPYLMLLQDTATGTPLFLSRVVDPRT
jgi:serpin B